MDKIDSMLDYYSGAKAYSLFLLAVIFLIRRIIMQLE